MKHSLLRVISIVISLVIVITVAACSSSRNETVSSPRPSPSPSPTPEVSVSPPETPPEPPSNPADIPEGVMISYDNYVIRKVSDDPLFRANGRVNTDVLKSLMVFLNFPALDPMVQNKEITAENFSIYVIPNRDNIRYSGAIVIKLFETIPESEGVHNRHLTEFTSQWWQLVYRTAEDGNDVLTLWMMQPYRVTPFNGTRFDREVGTLADRFTDRVRAFGDNAFSRLDAGIINTVLSDERISAGLAPCDEFFFEGNYSLSILRANLLRDTEAVIDKFSVSDYLVAPEDLPGLWQSSLFQTGTNFENEIYNTGHFFRTDDLVEFIGSETETGGLGATGLIWGDFRFFALANGMDGLSVGPSNRIWPNSYIVSTYDDLFWLPSDFEVRSMGFEKESARVVTVLTDAYDSGTSLRANRELYDEEGEIIENHLGTGRSGLWRLNGFDRAFDVDGLGLPRGWMTLQVWLRSADSLAVGNANVVTNTGNRMGYGVHQLAGMRPAVHLSVTELLKLIDD